MMHRRELPPPTSAAPPAAGESPGPARREHFLPVAPGELAAFLEQTTDFLPGERDQFRELCRRLEQVFELEGNRRLRELRALYRPLDPDGDEVALLPAGAAHPEEAHARFYAALREALERANYVRLSHEDVEHAVRKSTGWGFELDIDLRLFSQLEVFARGDTSQLRRGRGASYLWNAKSERLLPAWQRLVVVFSPQPGATRLPEAEANRAYLKLFKNIPRDDLELLLPGGRVRMSLLDRGRILLPTLSGLALVAWKILRGTMVLAFEGLTGGLATLGFLGGTLGYGLRSYYGYQQTRDKHHFELTRNLYFQNLDNNAGALFRVVEEAREQEFREALLAYFALWRSPLPEGRKAGEVDSEVEALLHQALKIPCDLEIDDALEKLVRFDLAEHLPGDRWRVASLDEALERLATYRQRLLGDALPSPFRLRVRRAA